MTAATHLRQFAAIVMMVTCLLPSLACAEDVGGIEVRHAWSRATPPGISVGVVYMTLESHGRPDRLLGLESTVAERAEIHEMREVNGAMQMRRIDILELAADEPVTLAPGGLHVMLIGLREPLAAGIRHTLTLEWERAGRIALEVDVRSP